MNAYQKQRIDKVYNRVRFGFLCKEKENLTKKTTSTTTTYDQKLIV